MKVSIITPDRRVVESDADSVVLPGVMGQMEVLPDHAAMIALLDAGTLSYRLGTATHRFTIGEGSVEVNHNVVTCLVESAEATTLH